MTDTRPWDYNSGGDTSALKELVENLSVETTSERIRKSELLNDIERLEDLAGDYSCSLDQKKTLSDKVEELEEEICEVNETLNNVHSCLKDIFALEPTREHLTKVHPEVSADLARFLDSGVLNYAVKMPKLK